MENEIDSRPDEMTDIVQPLAYVLAVPCLAQDDAFTGITVPTPVAPGEFSDD